MNDIKRTTIRAVTTAGAGDMAGTGTHVLQRMAEPFKVLVAVNCVNAYVFSLRLQKDDVLGPVVGEMAINSAVTPTVFELNVDPAEGVKTLFWTVVGTAPAGAISVTIMILEKRAKLK